MTTRFTLPGGISPEHRQAVPQNDLLAAHAPLAANALTGWGGRTRSHLTAASVYLRPPLRRP